METAWPAEFESLGEAQVQQNLDIGHYTAEDKATFGYRWLREKAKDRDSREIWTYRFTKGTFWAALLAVGIGIVGHIVTVVK